MIKLVVCDLDGTIIDEQNHCDVSVTDSIRKLHESGIAFAICTGRPIDTITGMMKDWGLAGITDFIVGSNGGEVADNRTGKRYYSYSLEPEVLHKIVDEYSALGLIATYYTADVLYVSDVTEEVNKVIQRIRIPLVKTDIKAMITKPEIKEMFIVEPAQMAEVEAYYQAHRDPRYIGFKTAVDLFEFNHPLLSKEVGLKIITEILDITGDEVMAFGDTTNDIEMLKYAKYGICMDNGTQDAKDVSFDIAPSMHDQGFARYIEEHIQNGNYV